MIPYGMQDITTEDIDAVISVLKSDFLTQGPTIPRFENSIATHVGSTHAIACNSATSALHIACMSLNLVSDDWVWTSPISFVASANCALYCGARIDFVDIDPISYNISVKSLARKLEKARLDGCLPKIIIPVHFTGQSCEMEEIHKLSRQYGFHIIEDGSHAIGAKYKDEYVGNCRFSDITVFSFHPVKIVTSGEGGIATTNNPLLASRMEMLRSHGITRDPDIMTKPVDGPWYYQQIELGYNYRMTDIHAALGCSQMDRLDYYIEQRHRLAEIYYKELWSTDLIMPKQHADTFSAHHLYVVRLKNKPNVSNTRLQILQHLRAKRINVNVHYIPIHTQPFFEKLGFNQGDFPQAEKYYETAITLPIFPNLKVEEQAYVIGSLKEALTEYL